MVFLNNIDIGKSVGDIEHQNSAAECCNAAIAANAAIWKHFKTKGILKCNH